MCHYISLHDKHTFTMSQVASHDGHILLLFMSQALLDAIP